MKNKLYLLERHGPIGYDEYDGQIVCAASPKEARELCVFGDEGDIWKNPALVSCKVLVPTKKTGMIMASYNGG